MPAWFRINVIIVMILGIGVGNSPANNEQMVIVENGESQYTIRRAIDAPASVCDAASQLQQYIAESTGVTLPILTEAPGDDDLFISVGDAPWIHTADIDTSKSPWESYRIRIADGRIWIVGRDTANGEQTDQGGTSAGTRNGVMTFLEEQLGVRWLMPGDRGDVVPKHNTWAVEPMDRADRPGFENRRLPYIQNKRPDVKQWCERQKLGYSLQLNHFHNWRRTVPRELFDEHPEWFAMRNGQRIPPIGRYKLETTNPDLIAYYAHQAIQAFDKRPELYSYSLSPSDSSGWSESSESTALTELDPRGEFSNTPLILKFYNDIARLVRESKPDRMVCGYIYQSYLYPPQKSDGDLEPNLMLVIAPNISYGYALYREDVRTQWLEIINGWANKSNQLSYYDLPVWWRQSLGAVTPVGPSILRFIFDNIHDKGFKGVYIYGKEAWGAGAVTNYIEARMMWDPTLDPDALSHEFFTLAYGAQAGQIIEEMYGMLDDAFAHEYRTQPESSLVPTDAMLNRLYAARFDDLEALYAKATQASMTEDQRYRLNMLGQNLIWLRWNLIHRGLLKPNADSILAELDEHVFTMITDPANRLSLGEINARKGKTKFPAVTVEQYDKPLANAQPVDNLFRLRGTTELIFYPLGEDEIRITPTLLLDKGDLPTYEIIHTDGQVHSGLLQQGDSILAHGSTREPLLMRINSKQAIYSLQLEGAPYALRSICESGSLHFQKTTTPIYFYVPSNVQECTVTLSSEAPSETAIAILVNPQGDEVGRIKTIEQPVDQITFKNVTDGGFWSIRLENAPTGVMDDVFIQIDGVNAFYVLAPQHPIIVTPR